MRRIVISLVTTAVLLVLFLVLCTFVRRPYEDVLLVRFGALIPRNQQTRIMYNWYLKMPTDTLVRIDNRLHLYPGTLQEAPTKGKEVISIQTFAAWRIVDPVLFYRKINADDEKAKENLDSKIVGLVQEKLSLHTLDELFNTDETKVHTAEIEQEVADEATNGSKDGKITGMRDLGIEIAEVGFSRMAFAPRNAPFVYQRMVEELKRQASAFSSEGMADAQRIRSEGDQAASDTRAKAIAKAQGIRGTADREALRLIAQVQDSPADREFYQFWKGLDFLKSTLTKNTVWVLAADSPWLKVLTQSPAGINPITPSAAPDAPTPASGSLPARKLELPSPANPRP